MSIEKRFFGKLDGKGDVDIYKITNKNGAFVELMTLGAGIHSINVPDRNGKLGDVILGFDDVNNYLNPDLGYQGLVVGRYANRIRDAKFSMDGVEYNTPKNQGTWTLHGGGRVCIVTQVDGGEHTTRIIIGIREAPERRLIRVFDEAARTNFITRHTA